MEKKSVMELKKRFTKNDCTISRIYTCYITAEEEIKCIRDENFLVMRDKEEKDFHKFLDIQKKTLSLKSIDLDFTENGETQTKKILKSLILDQFKNKEVLKTLIMLLKDNYLKEGLTNFLVTFVIDSYDVPEKTSDGMKTGESEEVYNYIICSICPVSLLKAGLGYIEESNRISSRYQDFIVQPPEVGFVYPSFIDRSSDDTKIAYFTKTEKKLFDGIVENVLNAKFSEKTEELEEESVKNVCEVLENIKEESKEYRTLTVNTEGTLNEENMKEKTEDTNSSIELIDNIKNMNKTCETNKIEDLNNTIKNNNLEKNIDTYSESTFNLEEAKTEKTEKEIEEENIKETPELQEFIKNINKLLEENKQKAEVKIIDGKNI